MNNDHIEKTVKNDFLRNHFTENISVYGGLSSAERIGAERGYSQGIADERRRSREDITKIVRRLKLRGYSLEHIAEDTGFSIEDVVNL